MGFDWEVFWGALTSAAFVKAAGITVALTVCAHGVAILIAFPLAAGARSSLPAVRGALAAYVWLFRGAPTLLQLLFVWNALPQFFPSLRSDWFTPFLAAWIALSLNEAAYQAEITRAAMESVDQGQRVAAMSLGMTRWQAFRHVILPQALRVAIPPTGNEFISLLKVTSLATVISLQELMTVTSQSVAVTFRFSEFYSVALIYYLAIVSGLMVLQARLERKLSWTRARKAAAGPALAAAPRIEHRS